MRVQDDLTLPDMEDMHEGQLGILQSEIYKLVAQEMIENAGLGVVMGNSNPRMKEIANDLWFRSLSFYNTTYINPVFESGFY